MKVLYAVVGTELFTHKNLCADLNEASNRIDLVT